MARARYAKHPPREGPWRMRWQFGLWGARALQGARWGAALPSAQQAGQLRVAVARQAVAG